jgi:hypothetical protein
MITATETSHELEYRNTVSGPFVWTPASIYRALRAAASIAANGNVTGAIEAAYDTWQKRHGNCHGVEFRVISRSVTVTVLGGEWTEDRLRARA